MPASPGSSPARSFDGPTWWPLVPAVLVTPLVTFVAQPLVGVRLDGARRLRPDGGARPGPLVVSGAARDPRRSDRAADRAAQGRAHPRGRLRHRPQSGDAAALRPGRGDRGRSGGAASWPASRLGQPIMDAPLPTLPGVPDRAYDMVAILDVIEHIDEDVAGMRALAGKMKPGAKMLITVPAFPWMWSAHDVVNHHKRRYTREHAAGAGRRCRPEAGDDELVQQPALPARRDGAARRAGDRQGGQRRQPCRRRRSTRLLEWMFGLERYALGRLPFPPGVSLVAIASAAEAARRHGRAPGWPPTGPAISWTM